MEMETFTKFQFQYGAIKGGLRPVKSFNLPAFQFQYGAIKGFAACRHLETKRYFNSNMVRLKAIRPTDTRAYVLNFNSNMVRLKA